MYDIAIIGTGIIGTAIARELSRYSLKTVMLEKSDDIAPEATGANDAMVPGGCNTDYYAKKTRFHTGGNALFPDLCSELSVPFKQTGALVYDTTTVETSNLENGNRKEITGLEICDPLELTIACAENAMLNGVGLKLDFQVNSIKKTGSAFYISSGDELISSRSIINCPGLYSDHITAMALDNTGLVTEKSFVDGFINMAGTITPSHSPAPAIALEVTEMILQFLGDRTKNPNFSPYRRPRPKLEYMSAEEKEDLVKLDPRFGNIVCKCEMISEGEIVDAIHRNGGATTVNGIKRRIRPGAGRCQGGFCNALVKAIIARETGKEIEEIRLEEEDSLVLVGSTL